MRARYGQELTAYVRACARVCVCVRVGMRVRVGETEGVFGHAILTTAQKLRFN